MGIINNDSYDTLYGTSVVNTYVSLGSTPNISLRCDFNSLADGIKKWILETRFLLWNSKNDRILKKEPYATININKDLLESQLNDSVFLLAYTELKTILTNTTDDI
jgi:hypothetical protein